MDYDQTFFDSNINYAKYSATKIVGLVQAALAVESVIDFGCAYGVWLSAWQSRGVNSFLGVDNSWVDTDRLLISKENFITADLSREIDLKRSFDLAQSLEVAEHLPKASSEVFVGNLVRHSSKIFFSAAPPGQGGIHHINEQPYEFWRGLFRQNGYQAFDYIRPLILNDQKIQPWYRFNTFLYVREDAVANLPPDVLKTRIPDGVPVVDICPWQYQFRKAIVRSLPYSFQQFLARQKRRLRT